MNKSVFQSKIHAFARSHKRDLPWRTPALVPNSRGQLDLYKIFVSEVMLQQTQVARVMVKYGEFIDRFPTIRSLAKADLMDVLKVWQGLGYNRRGKYLWESARKMIGDKSTTPLTVPYLDTLPGIGRATAASIYCFAYNRPVIFIETNIRKVFIHHFFTDRDEVDDADLIPLIRDTLHYDNPREWYYAIMDYGSFLSTVVVNPNIKSKHYTKQSRFIGSDRQIRGQLLRAVISNEPLHIANEREQKIYEKLVKEGMIKRINN